MAESTSRKREVDRILTEALDRPVEERQRFVEEVCQGDEWLCNEVMSLLRAVDEPDDLLEAGGAQRGGLWQALCDRLSRDDILAAGDRVGPYKVVSELGRGGMAVVYKACRADGRYDQEVALKVVKRGTDTEAVIRRFMREQQIHASLQHPAIARLIDAGETEDSRPFFVLELVDGMWIDRYCAEHHLGISERLRIFLKVAEAVQYAHQNLVLHRDLKPSNILVGAGSQVKLVDFGIAKSLSESDDGEGPALTRAGLAPMTLEYASPEQLRGARVTVASDVYQLGLVLYLLLVARPACEVKGSSPAEVEQVVCQQPPTPPSRAVLEMPEADLPGAHRGPGLAARRLARALAGDLDRIVLMALRKEPERRYPSVGHLAADIERYLEGKPISARKDTLWYRSGKFVRRHVVGVGVAALIVTGLALFSWQLAVQRDRAQGEADKARQVTDFVENLFRGARPAHSDGGKLTVREVLDRGADRIQLELGGQPETRAAVMTLMGAVYSELGALDRAEPLLVEGLKLREELLSPDHPDVASSLTALGALRFMQGSFQEAEALLTRAVAILQAAKGHDHPTSVLALQNLGKVYRAQGRYAESERVFRQCLAIQERTGPVGSPSVAESLTGIGGALLKQGKPAAAEELFERALAVFEQAGAGPLETSVALSNLGAVLAAQAKVGEAVPLLERAISLKREVFGQTHGEVSASLMNLGLALRRSKRSADAEGPLLEALSIQRDSSLENHPRTGVIQSELGALYLGQGRLAEAETELTEAVAVLEATLGASHPLRVEALQHRAELDLRLGRLDQALAALQTARQIQEQNLKPRSRAEAPLAETLVLTGSVLRQQGQLEASAAVLTEAVELLQSEPEAEGEVDVWRLAPLAKALLLLDRDEEAKPVLDRFAATELADPMLAELAQRSGASTSHQLGGNADGSR